MLQNDAGLKNLNGSIFSNQQPRTAIYIPWKCKAHSIAHFSTTCPLRLVQHDQTTTAWWWHELDYLRKVARKSFNKTRTTKLKEGWATYKSHLREYKTIVRQKQRDAWRSYCEEI
ncbi:unnamed protein product [Psylliodes chrysocephalus]|uniref:Uncharacterized protein n=1 Tax=Psylliodes chrysocephalus TaxID=3402493 RepID=A0A9P0G5P6_9CUCU|nr:unnamed protein product [Psylliodes chrysocephala]